MRKILLLIAVLALSLTVSAQVIQHDKDKEKQILSMEAAHWDFSPDWYYYFTHKDYSGAYLKWKWSGFKSGWRVKFQETRSNVRTVAPRRLVQIEAQKAKAKVVEKEREQIKKLNDEEIARSVDRNVDLVYGKYAGYFSDLQKSISDGLSYCLTASGGKLKDAVYELLKRNEVITANISYLRKMGPGYELENVKREQGYAKQRPIWKLCARAYSTLPRFVMHFTTTGANDVSEEKKELKPNKEEL